MHWDDASKTLTVGPREGTFEGMQAGHTFRVVLVGKNHGAGIEDSAPDKTIPYTGAKTAVTF
jgi:alpha-D-xyloside xylohydrolase